MISATVEEACALSCNINPPALRPSGIYLRNVPPEVQRRIDVTMDHIRNNGIAAQKWRPDAAWTVRLLDFRAMADRLHWPMAVDFPRIPAPKAADGGDDLSQRAKIPYEKLIAVLADMAGYALAEPFKDIDGIMAHGEKIGITIGRSKGGEILTAAKARRPKE